MLISKERVGLVLGRFSVLFPLPVPQASFGEMCDVWAGLFANCEEAAFNAAARALALRLRRFPFPADFVEEMAPAIVNTAQAATQNVAQRVVNV